ncbi:amidohydrolase [bacterium]|nr:amidohydrolase [bacterium]
MEDGTFHHSILISGETVEALDPSSHSGEGVQLIDLNGQTVLPAFTDCHVHFFETGLKSLYLDFSRIQSIIELQDMITGILDQRDIHQGWAYNPANVIENRELTREDLDRVSPRKPIFIRRVDGHSSYLNSAAIEMIAPFIFDWEGTDEMDNGILRKTAHEKADKYFLERVNSSTLHEAALMVQKEAIRKGCCCIHAFTPFPEWTRVLLGLQNELIIQTVPFCHTLFVDEVVKLNLPRIGGCILIDGSFGSHSAALFKSYRDDPGNTGRLYLNDNELERFFKEATEKGLQVAMHAIGPRAIQQYLDNIEKAADLHTLKTLRPRLEHAELPTPEHLKRVKKAGIILSMQPAFEYYWGGPKGLYYKRLGNRWKHTNPFKTILSHGITIIGGSDSYVTPIDPLLGIHAAVNHPNPRERLNVLEALRLFTVNPAFAAHQEQYSGSLKPGQIANLIILKEDPFTIQYSNLKDLVVNKIMIRGVFRDIL